MKIVKEKISLSELKKMAENMFGDLVKTVVDIKKEILVMDAELHSDQEAFLMKKGSKQQDLWGINIYPDKKGDNRIEFDSMINLRPSQNNRSRGVDDPKIQEKIIQIVNSKIKG